MNFENFSKAVAIQYNKLITMGELFYVEMERDELFSIYLEAFPEGTNNIYKTRREYDCNCCKQFIRNTGHVVAIKDGVLHSIWDVDLADIEPNFQIVADACSTYVKSKPVAGIFRSEVKRIGTPSSIDKDLKKWNHFSYDLPKEYVVKGESLAEFTGKVRTNKELLERGVKEIQQDSCETVHDLIKQKSLYRGEEHLSTVKLAVECIKEFKKTKDKPLWLWVKSAGLGMASRFKNSVIGTLLVDLSSGVELEDAVRMFESKVAPQNYKRPTALVTQKMIDQAAAKIEALGLTDAIARRCATAEDLTINNVLFADRSTKPKMTGGLLSELAPTANGKAKFDKVQEVTIEQFVGDILPTATSLEVQVSNKQLNNFMTLVAPVNSSASKLFKWDNNFSWSYSGEVADSMKERVKAAGGNVEGVLRFSIQWNEKGGNRNDFDAHAVEPGGNHIWFSNKGMRHRSSGMLDVDIIDPGSNIAVENIIYTDTRSMPEGVYKFYVNNYNDRGGIGFDAEIEFDGTVFPISYTKKMRTGENVVVAEVEYTKKGGFKMLTDLSGTTQSKEVWGVQTNTWLKVNMLLNSPNHWDGNSTGNKHWFFILDKCKNPDSVRGFYNEFLRDDLTENRKVFELMSAKFKAESVENQLSGVGFSSTIDNTLLCKVGGAFERVIKIKF
jgi:hypothetical protein